jgi:photosystem II stability/assembly factor-like uncharacterized protein
MKKYIFFLVILSTLKMLDLISEPRWVQLPGIPITNARYDDVFFVNLYTGWTVSGQGRVYKTSNGGINWLLQATPVGSSWFRCVGFTDSVTGFIGIYDSSFGNGSLIKTTNAGTNWLKVTNLPAPKPKGLCGISVVKNTNTLYAVGRIEGPAIIIKTTNAGVSWVNINVSAYATRLIDCYFTSPDSGFIVGANGGPSWGQTHAVILFTSDGGLSWVYRVNSPVLDEQFWKINFYSPMGGVASLNITRNSLFFFKTTDGGVNWERKGYPLTSGTYFTQGIGFINESKGWLGGDVANYTYETTNGGTSWIENSFGAWINRIRFLNDTIGYAGGRGVYKYTTEESIGISSNNGEIPMVFDLKQNFPNPFNPVTKIQYDVPVGSWVSVEIYNSLGQKIKTVYEGFESAGSYTVGWDGTNFNSSIMPSGIYFYTLTAGKHSETKKMVLVR